MHSLAHPASPISGINPENVNSFDKIKFPVRRAEPVNFCFEMHHNTTPVTEVTDHAPRYWLLQGRKGIDSSTNGQGGVILQRAGTHQKSSSGKTFLRLCPTDWTGQELSELHRIQKALQLAGVTTEISCGLSDEGDPWWVICRTGSIDVLAHFARIGGTYVGYWEGLHHIRSGDCLHDVSDHFLTSNSILRIVH